MKEVLLEVTQTNRNQVGSVGVKQRKPWKETEGGRKLYKEALASARGGGGTSKGYSNCNVHQDPRGHSRGRDYGRDVYCMLREVKKQLGHLQREMAKVVRSVGA